jgi:hypothetical protein
MPEYPDIYADGVSISASAFGMTITFNVSEPTGIPGTEAAPTRNVARIRMSPALASFVAEGLRQAVANLPKPTSQGPTPKSVS